MDTSRDPSKSLFAQSLRGYSKIQAKDPAKEERSEREMSAARIQRRIDEVHGEISEVYKKLQRLEKQYLKASLTSDGEAHMMLFAVQIKEVRRSEAMLFKLKAELDDRLKHVVNIISLDEAAAQQQRRRQERAASHSLASAGQKSVKRQIKHSVHAYSALEDGLQRKSSYQGTEMGEGYSSYQLLLQESREKQQPTSLLRGTSMKSIDMYSTTTALQRHTEQQLTARDKHEIRQQVAKKALAVASATFYRATVKAASKRAVPYNEPNTGRRKSSTHRPASAPNRHAHCSLDTSALPNNGLAMTLQGHRQQALGKPKAEPAGVPVISVRDPLMRHVEEHVLQDLHILRGSKGLYDSLTAASKYMEEEERKKARSRLAMILV